MNGPKILFYHTRGLGWSVYSARLNEIAMSIEGVQFSNMYPTSSGVVSKIGETKRKYFESLTILYQRWFLSPLNYLIYISRNGKPDVVHCAGHFLATGPWLFGRGVKIAVTMDTSFGQQISEGVQWGRFRRLLSSHERRLLKRCDQIHCTSQATVSFLTSEYGIDEQKVLHSPISVSAVDSSKLEAGIKNRSKNRLPKLVFVGNDFVRKGGNLLVDLHQQHFKDVAELHIYSSGAVETAIQKNVFIHGAVENNHLVNNILPSMDIFVMPTSFDQTPNAIIEAMAASLPVITFDTGGISEMVDNNTSGFVVPQGDTQQLQGKLHELISNKDLRMKVGAAGCAKFIKNYDASIVYRQLIGELVDLGQESVQRR